MATEKMSEPHPRVRAVDDSTSATVVDIRGLVKAFDGRVVLDEVDIAIGRREIVSIMGQSGGGKSTLLRCINLLERPDRGQIELFGQPVFSGSRVVFPSLARLRQSVGMVFQRFNLFPHLTAIENIMLAQMKAAGAGEAEAMSNAVRLLRRVRLSHRGLAFPDQMSGGEQQRVAIARALAHDPAILLLDEPFSALDMMTRNQLNIELLRIWSERRKTSLLVTHSIPEAIFLSDRIVVLGSRPARILDVVAVSLPRPRDPSVRVSLSFMQIVDRIGRLVGLEYV
jgi:ABC-type nitrate/sulfonate/bicarbonate transport system ATPase subunit